MRNKIMQIILILIVLLLSISIKYAENNNNNNENNESDKDINIILDEFEKDIKQSLNIFKKELEVTVHGEFMEQDPNDKRRLMSGNIKDPSIKARMQHIEKQLRFVLSKMDSDARNRRYFENFLTRSQKAIEEAVDECFGGKKATELRGFINTYNENIRVKITGFNKKDNEDIVTFELHGGNNDYNKKDMEMTYPPQWFYEAFSVMMDYDTTMTRQLERIFELLKIMKDGHTVPNDGVRGFAFDNYKKIIHNPWEIKVTKIQLTGQPSYLVMVKVGEIIKKIHFHPGNVEQMHLFVQLFEPALTKKKFDDSDLGKQLEEVKQELQGEKKKEEATTNGEDKTHTTHK